MKIKKFEKFDIVINVEYLEKILKINNYNL